VDESSIGEKQASFERKPVICAPKFFKDVSTIFWDTLPGWIQERKLTPTTYSVIEGLDAKKVNDALDDYNAGKRLSSRTSICD